jgi:hypothetical protein
MEVTQFRKVPRAQVRPDFPYAPRTYKKMATRPLVLAAVFAGARATDLISPYELPQL